jgi:hypothetical protein
VKSYYFHPSRCHIQLQRINRRVFLILNSWPPRFRQQIIFKFGRTYSWNIFIIIFINKLLYKILFSIYVKWLPGHHGRTRPQDVDGEGLLIWRVAANILNKQSRAADKGWSSSLWLGGGLQLLAVINTLL